MFSIILMPVRIRAIAIILLLVITTVILPASPVLAAEELAAVEETSLSVTSVTEPLPEQFLELSSEPAAELETVDDLSEEATPEPLPPVESTAEPTVVLTPEQALILALQAQITKLTRPYSDEQVQSIQMNLPRNLLRVEIHPDWYQLEDQKQDEIANKLFTQAQKLAFTKLEILNSQGQLIARSPILGKQMIILDRHRD